jgi:hypothetical protein
VDSGQDCPSAGPMTERRLPSVNACSVRAPPITGITRHNDSGVLMAVSSA